MQNLIGMGLYTPAEAGRLLHVRPAKIIRWLRGHYVRDIEYKPMWAPQVKLDGDRIFLGFRDLMEMRIATKFMEYGVSAQRIRASIILAREAMGADRPLSTDRFRTDGREIFFRVLETDEHGKERERLLNLFRRQYEFKQIIDPLLKSVEFDQSGAPLQWWPLGRQGRVVVDPARAFGQPIDAVTSVPTAILAAAGRHKGVRPAAFAYDVPLASVKRAIAFEQSMEQQAAA